MAGSPCPLYLLDLTFLGWYNMIKIVHADKAAPKRETEIEYGTVYRCDNQLFLMVKNTKFDFCRLNLTTFVVESLARDPRKECTVFDAQLTLSEQ